MWGLPARPSNLAVVLNLVASQNCKLLFLLLAFLTSTKEGKNKVQGRLLLDVVILEGASILELFPSEDEALLVWWNSLLVLDLGLDSVDGVASLNLQGDGLARQGLDKDLHCK